MTNQRAARLKIGAPAPELTGLTHLIGSAYRARPIEVIYFWATWCAPCKVATATLDELQRAHPARLSVRAVSTERVEALRAYLTDLDARSRLPSLSYAHLDVAEGDRHPYASQVKHLPFAFALSDGELVWRGNPTYPKDELKRVIERLVLEGEAPPAPPQESEALRAQLSALSQRRDALARELAAVNEQIDQRAAELSRYSNTFWEFDQRFWALHGRYLAASSLADHDAQTSAVIRYKRDIEQLVRGYAATLEGPHDDLVYMIADLYSVSDQAILRLDLAELLFKQLDAALQALQALQTPREVSSPLSYPDYEQLLRAERAHFKGALAESHRLLERAREMARSRARPAPYMRRFDELSAKIESATLDGGPLPPPAAPLSRVELDELSRVGAESCATGCVTPLGERLGVSEGVVAYSNCSAACIKSSYSWMNLESGELTISATDPKRAGVRYVGLIYQCVEYARRWWMSHLKITFGDVESAADIIRLTTYLDLSGPAPRALPLGRSINGAARRLPQRGDLIIYRADRESSTQRFGHVAVVVGVSLSEGHVEVAEQNLKNTPWDDPKRYARRLSIEVHDGAVSLRDPAVGDGSPDELIGWVYPVR